MDDAQAQAAAAVTAALFGEPEGEAAVAVVEAPETVSSTPAPAAADIAAAVYEAPDGRPEDEIVSFDITPEVPEDILREIDEADIDDQVEAEVAARRAAAPPDDEFSGQYGDEQETEDQIRERVKLEKRNQYLEGELAKVKSTAWRDEALKYFPLSKHALETINASSRRAFLKQAKTEHEKVLPYVQDALSDAKRFVDGEAAAARSEGKKAAAAAFGEPLTGPDVGTVDAAANEAAITQAREDAKRTGNMAGLFRALMNSGK